MWWKVVVLAVFLFNSFITVSAEPGGKPFLRIMVKSTVYNVGEKKAIYCKGENLENEIEWYNPQNNLVEPRSPKNTRVFVEKRDPTTATTLVPLLIQSAKTEDNGNWTCRSGDLVDWIDVLVGEKASIVSFKENVDFNEGQNAVLNCHTKGYPPPAIQWYQEITPIKEDTDPTKLVLHSDGNNLRLTIKNLTHKDGGDYYCRVTQEALTYFMDKRVYLNVKHKPVMEYSSTQEVYAILNEIKKITCNAIANPPPKYFWYRRRNGYDYKLEPITAEDSISTAEDGSYSILEIHMNDESYLGEYVCTASNTRGRESVVFHVSLGNKPNPPDFINCIHQSVNELLFNVTCSTCIMMPVENATTFSTPNPDNLTTLGYSFELVPVRPGYDVPDWENATEFQVDIDDPTNTTFPVGPLDNSTAYYVRVRSRNAAGYSSWIDLNSTPSTTAFAVSLIASITLIMLCYAIAAGPLY